MLLLKDIRKKIIFFSIFLFYTLFTVKATDYQIVVNYLKKAYIQVLNNKDSIAKEYLNNAVDYKIYLPEYYYIKNLILLKKNNQIDLQIKNTNNLIKILNKNTFIDRYSLLKQAINIQIKTRQFEKAIDNYQKLILIEEHRNTKDYLSLIKLLILKEKYSKIPIVIEQAKKLFYSLELDFYSLLYRIKTNNLTEKEFSKSIFILERNNFSKSRILFLKILFYDDKENIGKVFYDYLQMNNVKSIQIGYKKTIMINFLQKYQYLPDDALYYLLYDWLEINGLRDYTTNLLLNNSHILMLIKNDSVLKGKYLNFTGVRLKDNENDGKWEEFYEYKNGILQKKIIDENQDNIPEEEYNYYGNGKIDNYITYSTNNNFTKLLFNKQDSSLSLIERWINDKKKQIIYLYPSIFFPQKKDFNSICKNLFNKENDNNILQYISKTIDFEPNSPGYKKITTYNNGEKTISSVDYNDNGKYEEKIFYINNKINYILKDLNENNIYEIRIDYKNCKIFMISYSSNENYDIFDYKEEYYNDKTVKYWDLNKDSFFELVFEERNDNLAYEKIDVNNDRQYDYIYEIKKGIATRCFLIDENKWVTIKSVKINNKQKKKPWIVVSINDIDKVKLPDKIIIEGFSKMTGIFYYKNKKYFFENGIIKSDDFCLRIQKYDNKTYLFDISR